MDANDRTHRSQKILNAHQRPSDFQVRCQCDTVNEKGEMIECEECKQWQHTYCMGIVNIQNTNGYRCEVCAPRLLLVTKSDAKRYQEEQEADRQNPVAPEITRRRSRSSPLDPEHALSYIAEKCQLIDRPDNITQFFTSYKKSSGFEGHAQSLKSRCRTLMLKRNDIMSKFRMDIRAKMFFITATPVDTELLKELRKTAEVNVDLANRITSYKSSSANFSGKFSNRGCHAKRRGRARRSQDSNDEEEEEVEEENPMGGNANNYLEEDDLEILFDNHVAPVVNPVVKAEPAYSVADSYGNSTELIQNNTFPNYAPPPPHPNVNFQIPATPRYVAPYPNYMPHYHHHQMRMIENHALNGMNNLMQSVTGLFESQAQLMRELVNQRVQAPPTPPVSPQEEHASLRHFLDYFRMYIHQVNSPQLTSLNQEIVEKSRELGMQDKQIPLSRLLLALESAVALADSFTESFTFELTDAVEFFRIIRIYAAGQRGTQLHEFCEMLKTKMDGMDVRQKIHVEKIKVALEAAVCIAMLQ
ncbi:unnamed protein product [Caenorhabditis brenneri]